jgi:hypothetical protein
VYKHDPSISLEIGHGDSSWNVSLMLRAKKMQPSCPGSRDLNWTGKGLSYFNFINDKVCMYVCMFCMAAYKLVLR